MIVPFGTLYCAKQFAKGLCDRVFDFDFMCAGLFKAVELSSAPSVRSSAAPSISPGVNCSIGDTYVRNRG